MCLCWHFGVKYLCVYLLPRYVEANFYGSCGLAVIPGKPRVPCCEERPGAAHSRRDQGNLDRRHLGHTVNGTVPLEPLYVGQVGSVRGVVDVVGCWVDLAKVATTSTSVASSESGLPWGFCGGVGGVAGAAAPGGLRSRLYSRSSLVCRTDGNVVLVDTTGVPHCEERPGAAHSRRDQGVVGPDNCGTPLRGGARSRTLQEGPSLLRDDRTPKSYHGSLTAWSDQAPHTPEGTEVDHGTLRRHFGLWVCLVTGTRGLASFDRDASAIPCGGCA